MTCGVCEPTAFRSKGQRIYGYLVVDTMSKATMEARKLYYLGAEQVLSDLPDGPVKHRHGWKLLQIGLRSGDKLILLNRHALGKSTKSSNAHLKALDDDGIEVVFVKPEFFEEQSGQ